MSTKPTETPTATDEPVPMQNTTDATMGQPLAERVQARRAELVKLRDATPVGDLRERADLDLAISGADSMLTGDLERPPASVQAEMSRWLESNKHLAEKTPTA